MRRVPTRIHAVLDYVTAATLLSAPKLLKLDERRAAAPLYGAGAGVLLTSLLTDYEGGVVRKLPVKAHLALDAMTGATVAASPWALGTRGRGTRYWLPHVIAGAGEILAAALTQPVPADRGIADARTGTPPEPGKVQHGLAAQRAAVTGPPPETPGPSVTPPELPESETERTERIDATVPDELRAQEQANDPVEALVQEQEAAAAAEAAAIGGPAPQDAGGDPEMEPVYQAGGGPAEGFEAAEADLVDNAQHRDGGGDPMRDSFAQEPESEDSGAVYGEGDRLPSSQVVRDPDEGGDDPAEGPGHSAER